MAKSHKPAAFTVFYKHDGPLWGGTQFPFATFKRAEKIEAFNCLRRLAHGARWCNVTFTLKRERKTICRITLGEKHLSRDERKRREQFFRECMQAGGQA